MIGERLKEVRKDQKQTQAQLAQELNVSLSTVKSWERNNSDPSHELLVRICQMYHVTSDFLLGLNDDDPFLAEKRKDALSEDSKKAIRLFEAFLADRDAKTNKAR